MRSLVCLLIGYLLGSVSPASILSQIKGIDLRKNGTGNLGATNTILVMGKKTGLFVMALDIFKSYLAAKIAQRLFADFLLAGMLGALGAMLGHIYSLFLHFHGGKGLAALGGMIIAYKPCFFPLLLVVAIVLMLVTNLGVVGPLSAAVLFPILVYLDSGSAAMTAVALIGSALIFRTHWANICKIRRGDEILVDSFLSRVGFHHSHN